MDGVTQRVLHYKNQLETSKESKKIDHVFNRLEEMPVTVAVLQSTGIGKVVNGFRKHEGSIGRKAKAIVSRWKTMVAQEAMRLDAEREANDTGSNVSDNDVSSNKSYSRHSDCSDNMSSQESSDIDEKRDTSDEDYYQTKDRDSYNHNTKSLKDPENKHRTSNKHSHSEIRDSKSHKTYNTCNGLNFDRYRGDHNHSDKRRSSKTDTSCTKSDKSDQRSSSHKDRDTAKHSSKNGKVDSTLSDNKSSRDKGSGSHQSGNHNSHSSSSSKDDRSHRDDQLSDQDQSDAGKHGTKRGMSENKHREKDKHREDKHRGKDRHSEKSKHSEKEKYSEKDKYSEIDKHIEKDKQKHIEKEKYREKEKHKEKEKHSEKEKNKHRENKEKEKHTEKEKDKHRNKERDREKEKQKEKQREKGKHGGKDKHHVDNYTDQKDRNKLVYHDDIVESDSRLSPSITCRKFVDDEDQESPGHMFFDHHSSASQMDYSELSLDHVDGLRYSGLSPDHADSPQYSGLSPENESTRKDDSVHELPDLPAQSKNSTNHHKNSHSSKSGDRHKSHSSGQSSGQGHNSKHSGSHESSSSHSSKHSSSHSKSSEKLSSSKHSSKASSKSEAKKESDSQSKTYSEDKNSHKSDRKHSDKSHSKTSSKDSKPNKEKKRKSDHHSKEESSSKKSRRSSQQELGLSFADCLDLDSTTSSGKAKSKSDYEKLKSKFKIKKKGSLGDAMAREKSSPSSNLPSLKRKIEEGNLSDSSPAKQMNTRDISSTLPEISTSYRPWRVNPLEEKKKVADTTSDFDESLIGTKNYTRTQVYSGKKQVTVPELYSLQEICLRVLCNNIDNLENVGGVPYYILKPVLERCTAIQLYRIEDFNPQFVAETDMLWKSHCQKDFKGAQAEEFESWRELYIRKYDEREARLKSVRSNITASIAKAQPVRTAKLAYVDSAAKPPREVRRQQLKYGTAGPTTGERSKKYDKFATAMDPIAINREKREERNVKQKAPMMQKTLKMIKKIRR